MNFSLTPEQCSQISQWQASLPPAPATAIDGAFTYEFTPTQLGVVIKVKFWSGETLDITDYEMW